MTQVLFRKLILEGKLDGKKTNKKKICDLFEEGYGGPDEDECCF